MKGFIALLMMFMISTSVYAHEEKECILILELKQSHFTLDLFQHAKDAMNAVELQFPVSCKFYDQVSVGDNLVDDDFRAGSFIIHGSIGNWVLKVKNKIIK